MAAKSNFHVPLPSDVYSELRDAAVEEAMPATVLARRAIEDYLKARRRALVREAVAAYAAEMGGTRVDLDGVLEAAASDHLAKSDE